MAAAASSCDGNLNFNSGAHAHWRSGACAENADLNSGPAYSAPCLLCIVLPSLHRTPLLSNAGMLLSMADTSCGGLLAGHAGMNVYGPPGLNTLVNAFRTFVNVRDVGLKVHEFGGSAACTPPAPVVSNELVAITPVLLVAEGAQPHGRASSAAASEGGEPSAKRLRLDGSAEGQLGSSLDVASVAVESPAACYICELPDVPGKFLPQKVRLSSTKSLAALRIAQQPCARSFKTCVLCSSPTGRQAGSPVGARQLPAPCMLLILALHCCMPVVASLSRLSSSAFLLRPSSFLHCSPYLPVLAHVHATAG